MLTKRQTEQQTSKFLPEENDLKKCPALGKYIVKMEWEFY